VRCLLAPFTKAEQKEITELRHLSNLALSDAIVLSRRANQNAEEARAMLRG
jgi:hypothetical protein